ncbi:hypothetical protein HD806DRAFT_400052 [Xylariaceae sp. AK1471]|nr:hypothetical protein HD806DRAFT_400052 [Xylariaceae sp. AK1471]
MTNGNGRDHDHDNDHDSHHLNSTSTPQLQQGKGTTRHSITVALPSTSATSASASASASAFSSSRTQSHNHSRNLRPSQPPQPSASARLTFPENHPLGHPPKERQVKASSSLYNLWGVYPWEVVNPDQQPEKWSYNLIEKLVSLGRKTTLDWARAQLAETIQYGGILTVRAVSSIIDRVETEIDNATGNPIAPPNLRRSAVRPGRQTASPSITRSRGTRNTPRPRRRTAHSAATTRNQGDQGTEQDSDEDDHDHDASQRGGSERGGRRGQAQNSIEVHQDQDSRENSPFSHHSSDIDDFHDTDSNIHVYDQEEFGHEHNPSDFSPPFEHHSMPTLAPLEQPVEPVSTHGRGSTPAATQAKSTSARVDNNSEIDKGQNGSGTKRSRRQSLYGPRKRPKPSLETEEDRTILLMQPTFVAVNPLPLDGEDGSREDVLAHFLSVPAARCHSLLAECTELDRTRNLAEKTLEKAKEKLKCQDEKGESLRNKISSLEKEIAAKENHRTALLAAENEAVEAATRLKNVRKAAGLPDVEETPVDSPASAQVGAHIDHLRLDLATMKEELTAHTHAREELSFEMQSAKQKIDDTNDDWEQASKEYIRWCELTNNTALQVSLLFNLHVMPQAGTPDEDTNGVIDGPTVLTSADQLETIQTTPKLHRSHSRRDMRNGSVDLGAA